jgi:hypothetical protein
VSLSCLFLKTKWRVDDVLTFKALDVTPWSVIAQLEVITWWWEGAVSSAGTSDSRSTWEYFQCIVEYVLLLRFWGEVLVLMEFVLTQV